MGRQVKDAIKKNKALGSLEDPKQLAAMFANLYDHDRMEKGFHFLFKKVNLAASTEDVKKYAKYLYCNFAAQLKLHCFVCIAHYGSSSQTIPQCPQCATEKSATDKSQLKIAAAAARILVSSASLLPTTAAARSKIRPQTKMRTGA